MGIGSKAHYLYGQQQTVGAISLVPRSKFNFTVSMRHRNPAALGGLVSTDFERIASISMPGYAKKAQTLNQYNKKRVIQTGIDYAPITMLAYDTRDGVFEKFLKQYSEYYYAGSMNYGSSYIAFNSASAGTKLQEHKNFITDITINRVNSNIDTNIIQIYNPMITNIDADTLDYSDSGLVQYRITFIYEGYDIRSNDNPILTNERGFVPNNIQPLPESAPVVTNGVEDPSLFEQQDDLVGTTRPVDDDDVIDERAPGEMLDTAPPAGMAVDNSALDTSEVVAQSTDPTGAVDEQIVEETEVQPDGSTQLRTFKETPPDVDYRVYDEYVGQDVSNIPEDELNAAADSGSYYEDDQGKLRNYADDRAFTDVNREALDTTKWVNKDAVKGVGYDEVRGRWRAYNPKTNTYSLHESVAEANAAAVEGIE